MSGRRFVYFEHTLPLATPRSPYRTRLRIWLKDVLLPPELVFDRIARRKENEAHLALATRLLESLGLSLHNNGTPAR